MDLPVWDMFMRRVIIDEACPCVGQVHEARAVRALKRSDSSCNCVVSCALRCCMHSACASSPAHTLRERV